MRKLGVAAATTVFIICTITGCERPRQEANDAAIAQAKVLAAQTGIAQQVVWSDLAGNVFKVVVQPPLPGHTEQAVTRTIGQAAGEPRVLAPVTNTPSGPVISPVSGGSKGSAAASR